MNAKTVLRLTSARLRDLDLSPTEAFVLTRIDGSSPLEDVAELTGVPLAKMLQIARRLEELGAVARPLSDEHLPLVPRRTARDVYEMRLAPGDAFFLSCVDGRLSIAELADVVGWTADRALRSVEALVAHGALQLERAPARTTKAPGARHSRKPGPKTVRPPSKPGLDPDAIAKIDAALEATTGPTHYAVLGVPVGVSAKELRRAYFARAATLHTDRYFGKELGPYKKRLEDAFRRVTAAYELLSDDAKRAAYDATLPREARPQAEASPVAPPAVPRKSHAPPKSQAPPKKSQAPARRSMRPSKMPRKRSSAKLAAVAPAPKPAPSAASAASAASIAATAKSAQFLEDAQKALLEGNAAGAANMFRLALQIAVDPGTRRYAESGLEEARSLLADSYANAGRAAEKASAWSAAVQAYERAVQHRPTDPGLCERLANALREEGQDLVRAAELAESAVSRAPRRVSFRNTLARIHAQCGQRAKALEQLEAALAIEPDAETRSLVEKLRKPRSHRS